MDKRTSHSSALDRITDLARKKSKDRTDAEYALTEIFRHTEVNESDKITDEQREAQSQIRQRIEKSLNEIKQALDIGRKLHELSEIEYMAQRIREDQPYHSRPDLNLPSEVRDPFFDAERYLREYGLISRLLEGNKFPPSELEELNTVLDRFQISIADRYKMLPDLAGKKLTVRERTLLDLQAYFPGEKKKVAILRANLQKQATDLLSGDDTEVGLHVSITTGIESFHQITDTFIKDLFEQGYSDDRARAIVDTLLGFDQRADKLYESMQSISYADKEADTQALLRAMQRVQTYTADIDQFTMHRHHQIQEDTKQSILQSLSEMSGVIGDASGIFAENQREIQRELEQIREQSKHSQLNFDNQLEMEKEMTKIISLLEKKRWMQLGLPSPEYLRSSIYEKYEDLKDRADEEDGDLRKQKRAEARAFLHESLLALREVAIDQTVRFVRVYTKLWDEFSMKATEMSAKRIQEVSEEEGLIFNTYTTEISELFGGFTDADQRCNEIFDKCNDDGQEILNALLRGRGLEPYTPTHAIDIGWSRPTLAVRMIFNSREDYLAVLGRIEGELSSINIQKTAGVAYQELMPFEVDGEILKAPLILIDGTSGRNAIVTHEDAHRKIIKDVFKGSVLRGGDMKMFRVDTLFRSQARSKLQSRWRGELEDGLNIAIRGARDEVQAYLEDGQRPRSDIEHILLERGKDAVYEYFGEKVWRTAWKKEIEDEAKPEEINLERGRFSRDLALIRRRYAYYVRELLQATLTLQDYLQKEGSGHEVRAMIAALVRFTTPEQLKYLSRYLSTDIKGKVPIVNFP